MNLHRKHVKNLNLFIILFGDIILFCLAHMTAYIIRFEFNLSDQELHNMLVMLPVIIPIKLLGFNGFGLYQGMWRYTSLLDMWGLFKATFFSSLLILNGLLIIHRFSGYSRAVFILDGFLTFVFAGGMRVGRRSVPTNPHHRVTRPYLTFGP